MSSGTSRSVRVLPSLVPFPLFLLFLFSWLAHLCPIGVGGSTIVVLFEKGVVEWDEDLLINSRACLETLVRVGMGLGRSQRKPVVTDGNGNGIGNGSSQQ